MIMKGKGKGDRLILKDCPLQFPDVNAIDHVRLCSTYTSVLLRKDAADGIGLEMVDSLQTELETLLAAAAKRMRHLEVEIGVMAKWAEKGKERTPAEPPPPVSGKRAGKVADEKPSKRSKENCGKSSQANTPNKARGKVQHPKADEPVEQPPPAQPTSAEVMRLPKNDAPNRFWALVEPYCADIASEHLRPLQEMLRTDDSDYHKVPPLGRHFAERWAEEDLASEQRDNNRLVEKRRTLNSGTGGATSENIILSPQQRNDSGDEVSPFGQLTQRLVQALIEENIMTPLDDTNMSEADAAEAASISPHSLAKQLNISNTAMLERRIKKELEENGILEPDETADIGEEADDEIVAELRRRQVELAVVGEQNRKTARRLLALAAHEMKRQDVRRKMAAADAEVMDAYRRIQVSRQKKKTPTKKEKDAAIRAIKERHLIVEQLEAID